MRLISWLDCWKKPAARRAGRVSVPVEALESRDVPSATLSGGVLNIVGSSRSDTTIVTLVANDPTKLDVCENNRHRLFNVSQVTSIKAGMGGGNDLFEMDQSNGQILIPTTVTGGTGNDTLIGGGAADNLDGQAGNDKLVGQAGNDLLKGGIGADNLDGGSGDDQIFGGSGDDVLEGDAGNDTMMGEAGDDEMGGEQGNDVLDGGAGNDTVEGGDGADLISGGAGNDQFVIGDDVSELVDRGNGTDSVDLPLDQAPQAVQDAVNGLLGTVSPSGFHLEYTGADTFYEVEWTDAGIDRSALLKPDGAIVEETQQIDPASLPLAVESAIHARYRGATITDAALRLADGTTTYEADISRRGQVREIRLSEAGVILEDNLEPPVHESTPTDRFRDFSAIGTSNFANLNPGTTLTLEGTTSTGDTKRLVITVLDAVKMIDGVETRVVEERTFVNDQLAEIAKNYMALDEKTGNLYVFGEQADYYANGQIINHNGSWRSGVSGAKFGLLLPGTPRVGLSFAEERAPGVAQDHGQIVSTTDTVSTTIGNFTGVVKVRETTPLDATVEDFKYYAPGIGLVQSNEMKLISYTLG